MKISLLYIFLLLCFTANSQINEFNYKRPLATPSETWHAINLPQDVFEHIKPNFSDLRIYGITSASDTIEAPFLIRSQEKEQTERKIAFRRLNSSRNAKGYYFTFKVTDNQVVNELDLDFGVQNFDWQVDLEASQDQRKWFTLAENYRMVSIKNQLTNYEFTKLVFPNAKYRYLRVLIKTSTDPKLQAANIYARESTTGNYKDYFIATQKVEEIRKSKQTAVQIKLSQKVPVSTIQLDFKDTLDYYRNVKIQYLADSFKVANGWKYTYNTLQHDVLTSFEKNEFTFPPTILKDIKITIENNDNTPLSLIGVTAQGPVYQLVSRFATPANYALYYGNDNSRKPNYDIQQFENKIPTDPTSLALEDAILLQKIAPEVDGGLFQNKLWLWAIMALIIALLGWFSFKMLKAEA